MEASGSTAGKSACSASARSRLMVASRWAKVVAGRRIGVVVGGHVDGLHRGDGAGLGRADALLQLAHVGAQRRLVAHGAGQAAQQRRHLGAGLHEAEDVVDEQQHVAALVAEVLGHGDAGQADAQAGAGRLVHLAEDHRRCC